VLAYRIPKLFFSQPVSTDDGRAGLNGRVDGIGGTGSTACKEVLAYRILKLFFFTEPVSTDDGRAGLNGRVDGIGGAGNAACKKVLAYRIPKLSFFS
jgi:hypothetical protein